MVRPRRTVDRAAARHLHIVRVPAAALPPAAVRPARVGHGNGRPRAGRRKAAFPLLSLWVVALVGIRVLASGYNSPVDSRKAAAAITAAIAPAPAEIVFVDVKPMWGLSLYLGCEVERLDTRTVSGPTVEGVSLETIRSELARREPGTLLVIRQRDAATAAEALARLGRPYFPLGLLGDAVMVTPYGDLRRVAHLPDR